MQVKFMTLEGRCNKEGFVRQWAKSEKREATFVQTQEGDIAIMPYGHFTEPKNGEGEKLFECTYRSHRFVVRDFGIMKRPVGGGYLALSEDGKTCSYTHNSRDFGSVPSPDLVVRAVTENVLS